MQRTKMIQIRHVPAEIHRKLKIRAVAQGKSLSDYLNEELKWIAERPTMAELQERIRSRGSVELPVSAAEIIRQEREERESRRW